MRRGEKDILVIFVIFGDPQFKASRLQLARVGLVGTQRWAAKLAEHEHQAHDVRHQTR